MGTAAGANFARFFVAASANHMRGRGIAVFDEAFPEHWLAQVPVPLALTSVTGMADLDLIDCVELLGKGACAARLSGSALKIVKNDQK